MVKKLRIRTPYSTGSFNRCYAQTAERTDGPQARIDSTVLRAVAIPAREYNRAGATTTLPAGFFWSSQPNFGRSKG